ncbi:MAG: phospholipid/cholesterol/gamma-HCH transport system permease protein [Sphingobacteriales bacterium]|jgi:phospholipid/cholesterol/gamma-HCH transport system permease protein
MNLFFQSGKYFLFLKRVIAKPDRKRVFIDRFFDEAVLLGLNSMGIVALLSIFMGAVICLQTASNIDSPFIPSYTVGFTTRQSIILEFSPTIISLILAGKIGSNIASEIGSMRVTEQIDALEIMGVNSANYLVFPKILAFMFVHPFLILFSMALGIMGGAAVVVGTGIITPVDFLEGVQLDFEVFTIAYALIKTVIFAFVVTSISGFYGYYVQGGALEVGKGSTKAVVASSILILLLNYLITQLLLI